MPCSKCNGVTKGYICLNCGEKFQNLPDKHKCGSGNCIPLCFNCSNAETKCTCQGSCCACGAAINGWKCDLCGKESEFHIENHPCGGGHCMPKCAKCDQAEVNCTCA